MALLKRFLPILLCAMATPALGQSLLPDSFGQTAGAWTASSRQALDPAARQSADKNGNDGQVDAAAAREYGFQSGETAVYTRATSAATAPSSAKAKANGADALTVNLYRMKDASGAYGQYSYLRTPDMVAADFSEHASVKPTEAVILAGNFVLDVTGPNAQHNGADIKALLAMVGPKAQGGLMPTLPEHLPTANRVDRSDHYILGPATLDKFFPGGIGNSLGFAYGTEAETAHFRLNGRDVTLLVADFPTPQIAQSQLDALSRQFNVNGSQSSSGPTLFAERNQTLLSVVAGASSNSEASKLLDQVKSGTVLTWNEPTFQFKEPSIQVMILGAFIGTGVICMFAVVTGLAFGGVRLAVKKMFPNTVFDRSTQMDILQMGLTTKPIKSEDFYTFDGKRIDAGKVDKNLPDRVALRIFR